ncbi:hypothetical protein BBJ28_00010480, partial [Nothophytophthora sp. Chile5]
MPAIDEYTRTRHQPPAAGLATAFQHQTQLRAAGAGAALRASYQDPPSQKTRHSNSSKKSRHSLAHAQAEARSSTDSASSPAARRGSGYYALHTADRDASPRQQLHPEHPRAAAAAGDEILRVDIPKWTSKLADADRLHLPPSGADSAGNSPVGARSSTWNGKDGRAGGHGGSMGALVLGRGRADDAAPKKRYTVFQVYVRFESGAVRITEKRYSHFRELHKTLRRKYATVAKLYFPPKKFFLSLSLHVIEQRREAIESYMNAVLSLRPRPVEVAQFLSGGWSVEDDEDEDSGGRSKADVVEDPKQRAGACIDARQLSNSGRLSSSGRSQPPEDAGGAVVTMQDFEVLKMLGKGSFGKVYMARERAHSQQGEGQIYAMKVLRKSELVKRNQVGHTMMERRIMSAIDHPFIVGLKYAFQTPSKLVMVSDYCCGGEIFFHLKKFRSFSEAMVRFYAAEL